MIWSNKKMIIKTKKPDIVETGFQMRSMYGPSPKLEDDPDWKFYLLLFDCKFIWTELTWNLYATFICQLDDKFINFSVFLRSSSTMANLHSLCPNFYIFTNKFCGPAAVLTWIVNCEGLKFLYFPIKFTNSELLITNSSIK